MVSDVVTIENAQVDIKDIINHIINIVPFTSYEKTIRGLKFQNIEFIFTIDKSVADPCIVVKGKNVNFTRSFHLRNKLIDIYNII